MCCHTLACFHHYICRQLQKPDTPVPLLSGKRLATLAQWNPPSLCKAQQISKGRRIPLAFCSVPALTLLFYSSSSLHRSPISICPSYISSPITYFIIFSQSEKLLCCAFKLLPHSGNLVSHLCILSLWALHPSSAGSTNPSHLCPLPL